MRQVAAILLTLPVSSGIALIFALRTLMYLIHTGYNTSLKWVSKRPS